MRAAPIPGILVSLTCLSLTCLAWLASPQPAGAQVETTEQGVILNFQNVTLVNVFTALGQAAGVNVVSSNIPETPVTLRTAQPVPPDSIRPLIRQLALANGVSVSEQGGFLLLQGPFVDADEIMPPRQLYIHRLQHARAVVLASTLQALFGGSIPQFGSGPQPAQTLSQQLQAVEQQSAQQFGPGGGQGQQQQQAGLQLGGGELEGNVLIVPDAVTNSLLVRATVEDWAILEQAILQLDLRPLHVVIEVVIAEVSRTDNLSVGTSFSVTDQGPDPGESITGNLPGDDPGDSFTLGVLRAGDVDVDATLSALATTGEVSILSRPIIQAQNNVEARILVGSERPFVQVSQISDQGTLNEVIQYRDVGTALTILPTINEEGYVNLILTQEVSSATAETQFGAPVISTREATTQLLARSGQTIVIGGLVDQQSEETRSGIPFLKDIPILGLLFGSTRESVINSELFLFLTPYVVSSDEEADLLRQQIELNNDNLQELIPVRPLLPTVLPRPLILPDTSGRGGG